MKTSIIGFGWVGKAMKKLLPDSVVYDPDLNLGTKEEVNKCDIAFICVPTPYTVDTNGLEGKLDTSTVETSVA